MNYFPRSKIFLYSLVCFCVGIFLSKYFPFEILKNYFVLILSVIIFMIFFLFIPTKKKRGKFTKIFFILILTFSLGIYRYQSFLSKNNASHISFYNDKNEEYSVEGIISEEPARDGNNFKLQLSSITLRRSESETESIKNVRGDILVKIPIFYEVKYGDQVSFKAKLTTPKEFDDFDYRSYLARYDVYSVAKNVDDFGVADSRGSNADKSGEGSGFKTKIYSVLYAIKNYFSLIINKIYPEPHASFMLGILLGVKSSMPDYLLQIFKVIGVTHIIAVSGYNITILAKLAEKTLGKIGRKYIFWGVISMILFFVIITGAQASIVRAGIMGGLLVFAGFVGRKSSPLNVLVLAGAVMIFLNPLILENDIGFQLSFLATLGLVYISPIFEKSFAKAPGIISENLSATLAAQVFTMPIIISNFGLLSLISPVANILILPFVPISMFFGFASGLLGMIFLPLGKLVGFFGYIILEIVIRISEFLAKIPHASIELKMNNWYWWGVYYMAVGILIWWWGRRKEKKEL